MVNTMYLLTEWEGWMGKYLACSQDAQTLHSQEAFYHMTIVLLNFSDGVNLHQSGRLLYIMLLFPD